MFTGGQGLAAVAPRPVACARDSMLVLDRFAVVAQGVVVIHVPVGRRVLRAVCVKRRLVRHGVAPLGPLGRPVMSMRLMNMNSMY